MSDDFQRLAQLEPQLRDLERLARSGCRLGPNEAANFWYGTIKPRLVRLVGWHRRPEGAPSVEVVRMPCGLLSLGDMIDAWFRQMRANYAALVRTGPSGEFVHRELSSTEAYQTVYFHLLDVLEGRAQ